MTAPTKASLQRELRAMTRQRNDLVLALATASARVNKSEETAADIKAAARPVVAYMDTQWPGSVGPELRRLKELCK